MAFASLSRPVAVHVGRLAAPALRSRASRGPLSLRYASTKHFTREHEWIAYDESTSIGTVGITDYAQKALGDVVFVELPEAGSEVSKGDQIGAVESVKAASDIYAPLDGLVEQVNEALADQPHLLNKSPEDEGWLCKLKVSDKDALSGLLDEAAYRSFCEGEDQKH